MARKSAVTVTGPVTVRLSGLVAPESPLLQAWKEYPLFGFARNETGVPLVYHPPAGVGAMLPPTAGFDTRVVSYSVCHVHVIVEFWVMLTFTDVPEPEAGTSPVPVHPVHV